MAEVAPSASDPSGSAAYEVSLSEAEYRVFISEVSHS